MFGGFGGDSDDEDSDDQEQAKAVQEVVATQQEKKKNKKKRKKKAKAKKEEELDEDEDEDDGEKGKQGGGGMGADDEIYNEDDDFLDQIVEKVKIEKEDKRMKGQDVKFRAELGVVVSSEKSILNMEKKQFSYKKELKQLFADSAQ